MSEIIQTPITVDFRDIVTDILKRKNIHEGIWALYIEFGIVAVNMGFRDDDNPKSPKGPDEGPPDLLLPTAMVPVKKIGIVQAPMPSNLSVDAAVVNPKPKQGLTKKERDVK